MAKAQPSSCSGPDCDLDAEAAGLCFGHRKQQVRGDPLRPLRRYEEAQVRLHAAALALADADADDAYERAADRLEKAAEAFAGRGKRYSKLAPDVVPRRTDSRHRGSLPSQAR